MGTIWNLPIWYKTLTTSERITKDCDTSGDTIWSKGKTSGAEVFGGEKPMTEYIQKILSLVIIASATI